MQRLLEIWDRGITVTHVCVDKVCLQEQIKDFLQAHDGVWTITPLLLAMTLFQSLINTVITCEGLVVLRCRHLCLDKPA